jgi:LmbE family N-acetylglucosaminyl deacetylase
LDAVFPYARDLYAYPDLSKEDLQPHRVKEVWLWSSESPDYRSNITDTFDIKIAALRCHKSQLGENPSDLEGRLRQWHQAMAEGEDFELAEAFHRVEMW